ncbi:MAG: EamA family transporter [Alphaproteobacteria bacterium]|nr:EamA family transporter [Alphaproteobacteria bacterium]
MSPLVIALVLGAAVLHAAWNAALRSSIDRLRGIVIMSMTSATVALPFAVALPLPDRASWPYLAASAALQIGYCFFLVRAYREGDFGQIYPIARGSSPLLVTLGAALLAHEHLAPLVMLGVVLVSAGIFASARGIDRAHLGSVFAALAAGVFIAGYSLADGNGARLAGNAQAYTAWSFIAQGAPMPLIYLALRRRFPLQPFDAQAWRAIGGGAVSAIAYGIVIIAMSISPMGAVSALRETSILFAAIIARVFLGEPLTRRRIAAVSVIAIGAACLSLSH